MRLLDELRAGLDRLDHDALRRRRRSNALPCAPQATVDGRALTAFCSNDYLGLASEPALAAALAAGAAHWGTGAGASHLVSGHYDVHDELESALARFVGSARALYFSTGYMANSGILPALAGRGDAIFADRLNHASLVDGMLLSRATLHRYPHADTAALDRLPLVRASLPFVRPVEKTLNEMLDATRPPVVVSAYPLYNYMMARRWHRDDPARPRLITVVTDSISVNRAWHRAHSDWFVTPNQATADVMIRQGVPAAKVLPYGFPVSSRLAPRSSARNREIRARMAPSFGG